MTIPLTALGFLCGLLLGCYLRGLVALADVRYIERLERRVAWYRRQQIAELERAVRL